MFNRKVNYENENNCIELNIVRYWHLNLVETISKRCRPASIGEYSVQNNWATADKTNNKTWTPSKDSDQPAHPCSLVSLRCPHEETLTVICLGRCPGWSECSLGAHVILLLLSCFGSITRAMSWENLSLVFLQPGKTKTDLLSYKS